MKRQKRKKPKSLIYLASQSPRRKELLRQWGVPFQVVPSSYREKPTRRISPSRLVTKHALGKARGVSLRRRTGVVLGADTIVCCRGRILGKPRNRKDAFRMLSFLSGRPHYVYTGIALISLKTQRTLTGYVKTKVFFKKLMPRDIENYLGSINPLDKAGSYAVQEGKKIVQRIEGPYSNVIGLPVELLLKMLKKIII